MNIKIKKFDDRDIKGVFLGYPPTTKGYIIYDLMTKKLNVSRHVVFLENNFPFANSQDDGHDSLPTCTQDSINSFLDYSYKGLESTRSACKLDNTMNFENIRDRALMFFLQPHL